MADIEPPPEDSPKRAMRNRRINVDGPLELQYWCDELRITEEQLREAVAAVGVMEAAVRRYLGKR